MTFNAVILWLLCLSCETIGQLMLKAAALKADGDSWRNMLGNFWIWLGITCYAIEFFIYMAFLALVPLAQGVLICSLSIMTIMICGKIFFKEQLSSKRVFAGILITAGVCLVGWS